MGEEKMAERFCRDVDGILLGTGAGQNLAGPVSEEYRRAVDLARTLAEEDFSGECRVRQILRLRLLDMFTARGVKHVGKIENNDMELGDEELENVAGGIEKERKESCSLYGCRRRARTITGGNCPDCGHPRECHPL